MWVIHNSDAARVCKIVRVDDQLHTSVSGIESECIGGGEPDFLKKEYVEAKGSKQVIGLTEAVQVTDRTHIQRSKINGGRHFLQCAK
jgi:hypothetical protein